MTGHPSGDLLAGPAATQEMSVRVELRCGAEDTQRVSGGRPRGCCINLRSLKVPVCKVQPIFRETVRQSSIKNNNIIIKTHIHVFKNFSKGRKLCEHFHSCPHVLPLVNLCLAKQLEAGTALVIIGSAAAPPSADQWES